MKIALSGTGRMGASVRRISTERGHEVVAEFDIDRAITMEALSGVDVVIDFSHAAAISDVLNATCGAGVNLVIGTTGWNDRIDEIRQKCLAAGIGIVWAPNFSPGANILFAISRQASQLAATFGGFESGIEERHHVGKKDSPSGTAIRVAEEVEKGGSDLPGITAKRVGHESGLHTLFFDSADDLIELTHRARGRDGFARGAVIAAELLEGKKGFFSFEELIGL